MGSGERLHGARRREAVRELADPDIWNQRGSVHHRMKNFSKAAADLRRFLTAEDNDAVAWNLSGLCEAQLGNLKAAFRAYERATALDAAFKEAWLNLAQLHRESGAGKVALRHFERALAATGGKYPQALQMRGLCHHGMGRTALALADFQGVLRLEPNHAEALCMAGVCCQSLGRLRRAVERYDALLAADPGHVCWYNRELCLFYARKLDAPLAAWCADRELDPYLKEAQCKRYDHRTHAPLLRSYGGEHLSSFTDVDSPVAAVSDVATHEGDDPAGSGVSDDAQLAIVKLADRFGQFVQLDCVGFLSNKRQHRQFGLAVVQIAQRLRRHWHARASVAAREQRGGAGLRVDDSAMSRATPAVDCTRDGGGSGDAGGGGGSDSDTRHVMDWRDTFDVAVRWRQISEPNDPVWWIDCLAPEAFNEGFGLQTPIINGQLKVIRYYPYFNMAFGLMKDIMARKLLSEDASMEVPVRILREIGSVRELYAAWGKGDFWVVSPCCSTAVRGREMEGTRLTIQRKEYGFEFTIRTPGTPDRWRQYDEELDFAFRRLDELAATAMDSRKDSRSDTEDRVATDTAPPLPFFEGSENSWSPALQEKILDEALTIFFYWVNFGPLSRGSAACGYAVFFAVLTAFNIDVSLPWLRRGVQLDWEAILRPTPAEFIRAMKPEILPKLAFVSNDLLQNTSIIEEIIPTLRDAFMVLNID